MELKNQIKIAHFLGIEPVTGVNIINNILKIVNSIFQLKRLRLSEILQGYSSQESSTCIFLELESSMSSIVSKILITSQMKTLIRSALEEESISTKTETTRLRTLNFGFPFQIKEMFQTLCCCTQE